MVTLTWTGPLRHPGLVKFKVPGDGSCLIHALLLAYHQKYRLSNPQQRKELVRKFRHELAHLLGAPSDPLDPRSPLYYDIMARGQLREMSSNFPRYRLNNMQKILDSDEWLDYMFFEVIGDALEKDLYILDLEKQDVLITSEEDLYQKNRPSIVLGYKDNHYELIGLVDNQGVVKTLFRPDDDFIVKIKARQMQIPI